MKKPAAKPTLQELLGDIKAIKRSTSSATRRIQRLLSTSSAPLKKQP